jgi:phage shock protein E
MELSKQQIAWKWSKRILPVVLGAVGGFLYYQYIGCVSGTCAITSNPWLSTGYGALIGAVFTSWKPNEKK